MRLEDQHVLAALRATGGGLPMREIAYQMARQGRPAVADLAASLRRLQAAGLVHRPYAGCESYSAVARPRSAA